MNQSTALSHASGAVALYLVLLAVALDVQFGPSGWCIAAVALWAALSRARGIGTERERTPGLVLALLRTTGLGAAALLTSDAHSLLGELALALALPIAGYTLIELALTAPDTPPRLVRQLGTLPIARLLSVSIAGAGLFAAAPPLVLAERALIAPYAFTFVPRAYLFGCALFALLLRLARRRLGSDTRSVSANGWPTFGLALGVAIVVASVTGYALLGLSPRLLALGLSCAALTCAVGHVFLVSPGRALIAAPWVRGVLGHALALAIGVALAAALVEPVRALPAYPALLGACAACGYALLQPAVARALRGLLAPHRARLLNAIDEIREAVVGAVDAPDLVARMLKPLRVAAGSPEAAPMLFVADPAREYRLDAAGIARGTERMLPRALLTRFAEQPSTPLISSDLRGLLPRRPELRELSANLDEFGALAVVPLVLEGASEGWLVIPRGARTAALSLEELLALEELSRFVTPFLAARVTAERALGRARLGDGQCSELTTRVHELQDEREELASEVAALRELRGDARAPRELVAYSDAMRGLRSRIASVAAHDVPLLLLAEAGVDVREVAEHAHRTSSRMEQAFVAIDCAAYAEKGHVAALAGSLLESDVHPGWLNLAGTGTLFLQDLTALSLAAQRMLALALSERVVLPLGATAPRPMLARVILSARRPLGELVEDGRVVTELARWVSSTQYHVPPLRERGPDVESLVLFELDRAARVVGRDTPGLAVEARAHLLEHSWPGNYAELVSVIERAVSAAQGPRISLQDLPVLAAPPVSAGSFVDQEREILARALEQAGGNRTQAARALGLKRQTLVEKLRKHGLEAEPRGARH